MMSDAVEGCLRRHSSALGNAPDYDTPEPRLAILGPPAVTRHMLDLWRANSRLQARFDLRNPLHRRDYLLWLSEKDRSVGDDTAGSAAVPGDLAFSRATAMAVAGGASDRAFPRKPRRMVDRDDLLGTRGAGGGYSAAACARPPVGA